MQVNIPYIEHLGKLRFFWRVAPFNHQEHFAFKLSDEGSSPIDQTTFLKPQFIQAATKIIHYPCQMAMGSKSLISQSIYDLQCMWSSMPSTLWIHCHPLAPSLALKRLEAMPAWAQKVRSRCLGVVHPIPTGWFIGILRFLRWIQTYSNTEDSEDPY